MTDKLSMLLLETDLFGDRNLLSVSIQTGVGCDVRAIKVKPEEMDETSWRNVVRAIKSADKVLLV